MTLAHIALSAVGAVAFRWLCPPKWRGPVIVCCSILLFYILFPAGSQRYINYILPTITLATILGTWMYSRPDASPIAREDLTTLSLIGFVTIAVVQVWYSIPSIRQPSATMPDLLLASLMMLGIGGLVLLPRIIGLSNRQALNLIAVLLLSIFVALKASVVNWVWLGFSYIAFRLLHVIRDYHLGRLPEISLQEMVAYVLFFPSLLAGPIDRVERFAIDFRKLAEKALLEEQWIDGLVRILVGVLKKFVVADNLMLLSLSPINADQFSTLIGGWVLLYVYGIRLYLDFSGYSDIAIGFGILLGIQLPENFNSPYTRSNLAAFWQSWHITLSNWARFYVFTPLSRKLLNSQALFPTWLMVFVPQLITMLLIGLWHGMTWNFAIWGIWHGVGLFVHKQWSDATRKVQLKIRKRTNLRRLWSMAGWLLTFNFVMMSWVWFAFPDFQQASNVFLRLLGLVW